MLGVWRSVAPLSRARALLPDLPAGQVASTNPRTCFNSSNTWKQITTTFKVPLGMEWLRSF